MPAGVGVKVPVPLKLMVWGLPLALSVMDTDALRAPVADGVNFAAIVQLVPAVTLLQLFVCEKSPGFVPVSATLVMFKAAVPVLRIVSFCAPLLLPTSCEPKLRLG